MNKLLYFVVGAASGSLVTYFVCNNIYKDKLLKQAEELHQYYTKKKEEEEESCEDNSMIAVSPSVMTAYHEIAKQYAGDKEEVKPETKKQTAQSFGPYPISSGEFGENGYEPMMTWNYYPTSKVLVDAEGHELSTDDIAKTVGLDFASHFGDVDDDDTVLYIRNEELNCDFEIFDNGEEEYISPTVNVPARD